MEIQEFKIFIQDIVKEAKSLKDKHTNETDALVNYACIFCQNEEEFKDFNKLSENIGKIIKQTPTGSLFHIDKLNTVSGELQLLKIRKPEKTRPEKGDVDFTISDYTSFKNKYLSKTKKVKVAPVLPNRLCDFVAAKGG